VLPSPGAIGDEDALIAFCRAGLPSFKRPRRIVFVTEYPMTATGKIRRVELRAQAATIMAAPVSVEQAPADPVPLQPGH
jgi:benzoate-CoA ligase